MYRSSQAAGYLSTVKMQLTGPFIPKSLTHVHVHVEIEGSVHTKTYEADPDLTHTFAWNKRNVYKQKVYGIAQARISIGYQYSSCATIIWETQTATLQGFDVDISDVGGWGLDIHHHYNFHEGILQKGDGSTLHFKQYPRKVNVVMGTGQRRDLVGQNFNGLAKDARLLTPVALASGPDGSIYVGDFDLVRRITPEGNVYTVLILRYVIYIRAERERGQRVNPFGACLISRYFCLRAGLEGGAVDFARKGESQIRERRWLSN